METYTPAALGEYFKKYFMPYDDELATYRLVRVLLTVWGIPDLSPESRAERIRQCRQQEMREQQEKVEQFFSRLAERIRAGGEISKGERGFLAVLVERELASVREGKGKKKRGRPPKPELERALEDAEMVAAYEAHRARQKYEAALVDAGADCGNVGATRVKDALKRRKLLEERDIVSWFKRHQEGTPREEVILKTVEYADVAPERVEAILIEQGL